MEPYQRELLEKIFSYSMSPDKIKDAIDVIDLLLKQAIIKGHREGLAAASEIYRGVHESKGSV